MAEKNFGNYQDIKSLELFAFEAIVPGICQKCGHEEKCESDAKNNYCEVCKSNSVISVLVLHEIF